MASFQKIMAVFWSLVGPWQFLGMATKYLPGAIIHLYAAEGLLSLLSWSRVRSVWFSRFWSYWGAQIRKGNNDKIIALLQGRVFKGAVVDEAQTQPLGGVVLDIGPGVGFWVDIFSAYNEHSNGKVTRSRNSSGKLKIYGVEPSTDAHAQLKERITAAGLDDVYEVLPIGIQSIAGSNNSITEGSVDCIVSFLCLCGIPEPERNIQELYKLLKPGGRWYLYEHVRVKRSVFMRMYQRFVNIFWPQVLDGCQLCRDTEGSLRKAGPWSVINIAQPIEEPWHQIVPHIFGTMTK